ncbi:SRPBCC domain-containing protein [Micromonospora sp. 4G57]|uniref:SRPBCC domain-containing protein n=1 Tax=Micromonospora sicca TaxID=2202420 RepID=A0ABU5JLE6_9ACTN|nr:MULTISPECIES: SRPBCC domain-containing protein [unclassified Micromonospora]MDZ5446673.1 SRPBCC domain-containing protein [Micromonospora sp. 4G57]MDZ5493391.1 SRPBCC domain-containing protein [Micromonospora sp. 4G53]
MSTAVRLHRDLPAPPEKVYRAWLDPDLLRRWLAPSGLAGALLLTYAREPALAG